MFELQTDYSLVNEDEKVLSFENSDFSMRAETNINKIMLQISTQGKWDHALLEQSVGCHLSDNPIEQCNSDSKALWLSPNEWLIISSKLNRKTLYDNTKEILHECTSAVTDLTDRFSIIELKGEAVWELLMSGCSIDLDPNSFQSQQYRLTQLANLPIILFCHQSANYFWVIVDRSEARYLWDWLVEGSH